MVSSIPSDTITSTRASTTPAMVVMLRPGLRTAPRRTSLAGAGRRPRKGRTRSSAPTPPRWGGCSPRMASAGGTRAASRAGASAATATATSAMTRPAAATSGCGWMTVTGMASAPVYMREMTIARPSPASAPSSPPVAAGTSPRARWWSRMVRRVTPLARRLPMRLRWLWTSRLMMTKAVKAAAPRNRIGNMSAISPKPAISSWSAALDGCSARVVIEVAPASARQRLEAVEHRRPVGAGCHGRQRFATLAAGQELQGRLRREHHPEVLRQRQHLLAAAGRPQVLGRGRHAQHGQLGPAERRADLQRVARAEAVVVGEVLLEQHAGAALRVQVAAAQHDDLIDGGLPIRRQADQTHDEAVVADAGVALGRRCAW